MSKLKSMCSRSLFRRLFFDIKLKYKLIIFFSFIILIPLIMLGVFYNFSMERSMIEFERQSLTQGISQLSNTMDMFLDTYLSASSMLFNNAELQKDIVSKPEDFAGIIQTRFDISNMLDSIQSIIRFPEIRNSDFTQGETLVQLYIKNDIIGNYGGDIINFSEIENEPWCKSLYQFKTTVSWQTNIILNKISYVALNRRLANFTTGEDIGVLRVYIPSIRLQRILEKFITKTEDMVLFTSQDSIPIVSIGMNGMEDVVIKDIMLQQQGTSDKEITIFDNKYLIRVIPSEVNGWKLYYFVSMNDIAARKRTVTIAMAFSVFVALVLCIGISITVSFSITRRLSMLVDKTNQTGKASLVADLHLEGEDEIGLLDKNFNRMLERINELIENEYKLELYMNQTRLELLQEQINPHMLYNTLSTISMISKQSGALDILNVTNNLIVFYKGILSTGKLVTSISDEITMIDMYVEIMKFVYKIDIDLIYELDKEILSFYSLKLILQPIVENAVVHGLRPVNGGIIIISGHRLNNKLYFEISDSGVGIPDDIKGYLSSSLGKGVKEKGYGLSNVARRINLFFGDEYVMRIESNVGCGTKVSLSVPVLNKEENDKLFNGFLHI